MTTRRSILILIILICTQFAWAQLYFPPNGSDEWETLSPDSLDWCGERIDSLYELLDDNNTKAFILLKNGKVVLEKYFDGHDRDALWYWASAGKTLTAFMVGIAQEDGFLSIDDPTSDHLGEGWTNCEISDEKSITIRNQLSMTSGLDDGVADPFCTLDTCLNCIATHGTRWSYHNAPYTLLDPVIENATGMTLNQYTNKKLKNLIGMNGLFLPSGYNNVYFSNARSMARFGLLILNKGNWNGTQIMTDTAYFHDMTHRSQEINQSYGYLWWLNGQESFMVPQSHVVFPGSMFPNAPADMIAALGRDGQFINVVPSQNLVWIRMGAAPSSSLVPVILNLDIWDQINQLECETVSTDENVFGGDLTVFPNPTTDRITITLPDNFDRQSVEVKILNVRGETVATIARGALNDVDLKYLSPGTYFISVTDRSFRIVRKLLKAEY